MALENVKFGFYNSKNHDRVYNAGDLSSLFNGLIADGIFATVGNGMVVKSNGTGDVIVSSGRAWFDGTWTDLAVDTVLEMPGSHPYLNRIDVVYIETNSLDNVRANSINVKSGEASDEPIRPSMERGEYINQYPLAFVYRPSGSLEITGDNITVTVGSEFCPFVTGIIDTIDVTDLLQSWNSQIDAWLISAKNEWNIWFNTTKANWNRWYSVFRDELTTDQALNLQRQIIEIMELPNVSTPYRIVSVIGPDDPKPSLEELNEGDIFMIYT